MNEQLRRERRQSILTSAATLLVLVLSLAFAAYVLATRS